MTKKMRIWVTVSFCLFILTSLAAGQQEQWLQYTVANEAWQILGDMGAATPRLRACEGITFRPLASWGLVAALNGQRRPSIFASGTAPLGC